jgi:hypothetical protein
MQFEKQQFMDAHKDGQDSIDFIWRSLILRYQKNIMIKFMEKIESYYYTLTLVDSELVDVKVIQRHKGCVEVSRDLDSMQGFG